MLTQSGADLRPDFFYPPIHDAAVQLDRIFRFTGATNASILSVAAHSLFVDTLSHRKLRECAERDVDLKTEYGEMVVSFCALTHDITDIYFSDIPHPAKPPEIEAAEKAMLAKFFLLVGLSSDLVELAMPHVHYYDNRAVLSEARLGLGREAYGLFRRDGNEPPDADEVAILANAGFLENEFARTNRIRVIWESRVRALVSNLKLSWS